MTVAVIPALPRGIHLHNSGLTDPAEPSASGAKSLFEEATQEANVLPFVPPKQQRSFPISKESLHGKQLQEERAALEDVDLDQRRGQARSRTEALKSDARNLPPSYSSSQFETLLERLKPLSIYSKVKAQARQVEQIEHDNPPTSRPVGSSDPEPPLYDHGTFPVTNNPEGEQDPFEIQLREVSSPAPGTCLWIRECEKYQQWKQAHGKSNVLVVLANPGLGKTVLAKSVHEHLKKELGKERKVLSFFCQRNTSARDTMLSVLASFLYSILVENQASILDHAHSHPMERSGPLARYLIEGKSGVDEGMSLESLWGLLLDLCRKYLRREYYFILDALDECSAASQRDMERLMIGSKDSLNCHLLITARPEAIPSSLASQFPSIEVLPSTLSTDAAQYVLHGLEVRSLISIIDAELVEKIQEATNKGADGMFLILSCRLDEISSRIDDPDFETTSEYISQKLDQQFRPVLNFFGEMLAGMATSPQMEFGITVLNLLLASQQSLTKSQLTTAFMFCQYDFSTYDDYFNATRKPHDIFLQAKKLCGSLLRIRGPPKSEGRTVAIVHDKARELLEADPDEGFPQCLTKISSKNGHVMMAISCLRFLLLPEMAAVTHTAIEEYAFLLYALQYWPLHVSCSEERVSEYKDLLATFLSASPNGYHLWAKFWPLFKAIHSKSEAPSLPQAISITLVEQELGYVIDMLSPSATPGNVHLCGNNIDLNEQDGRGQNALTIAIGTEKDTFADKLLDLGADPNIADSNGVTPVHLAVLRRSKPLIRKCWEKGARLDAETLAKEASDASESTHAESPLVWSASLAEDPDMEIFEFLRGLGAQKIVRTDDGWSILHDAAYRGNLRRVKYIMEQNLLDVDCKSSDGSTPLIEAAGSEDSLSIAKYLIETHGASMDHTPDTGRTALWEAILSEKVDTALFLVDKAQNIDQPIRGLGSGEGWRPLHLCASRGFEELTKRLLAREVEINALTEDLRSPLLVAVDDGQAEIVKVLIDAGADLDLADDVEDFPLMNATVSGRVDIAKLLIKAGANTRALKRGISPLHMSAWCNYPAIAESLILSFASKGDINEVHHDSGFTPLICALRKNHVLVAKILLAAGADLYISSSSDWLPLHFVCFYSKDAALFNALFDGMEPGDIDDCTTRNSSPLHLAAENAFEHAVCRLLEVEADLTMLDEFLNTPLMYAAKSGSISIVKMLLKHPDCRPSQQSKVGWTALHYACQYCHDYDIVYRLMAVTKWNCRRRSTATPMSIAVWNGNNAGVAALLDSGMPPDFTNDCGKTPLYDAIDLEDSTITTLLLGHGADKDSAHAYNVLPYVVAISDAQRSVFEAVKPTNPDQLRRRANTTLVTGIHEAAKSDLEAVKWMLDAGLDPLAISLNDFTALHCAASRGQADILEYLLDQPGMPSLVNLPAFLCNTTCLMTAAQNRSPDSVRVLLEKGKASISQVDFLGFCVFDYAYVHKDTMIALIEKDPETYAAWRRNVRSNSEERDDVRARMGSLISWIRALRKEDPYYYAVQNHAISLLREMLLFVGDEEHGITAREIEFGPPSKLVLGFMRCLICRKVKRARGFMCSVCTYAEFCQECADDENKMFDIGCSGHRLIQFPRDSWSTRDSNHVNDDEQTESIWFEALERAYEDQGKLSSRDQDANAGKELSTHAEDRKPPSYSIHFDYPKDRISVFELFDAGKWEELRVHFAKYPRDIALKNAQGDNLAMLVIRKSTSDNECLSRLRFLDIEAVPMLVLNDKKESTIGLASEKDFSESLIFLLSHYNVDFNKLEDPSSSKVIQRAVTRHWHDALKLIIERHFDWASRGAYEYLQKLDALGLTDQDIVAFLEQDEQMGATSSPSADSRKLMTQFQQPKTGKGPSVDYHADYCPHQILRQSLYQQRLAAEDRSPTSQLANREQDGNNLKRVSSTSDSSITEEASFLCGYGGVFPNGPGSLVRAGEYDDFPTVLVSYAELAKDNKDPKDVIGALYSARKGLLQAMWSAQNAGVLCDAFTVLCDVPEEQGTEEAALVRLVRIPLRLVLDFIEAVGKGIDEHSGTSIFSLGNGTSTGAAILELCQFQGKNLSGSNVADVLNFCSEVMQFLCLGFLSFLNGHSSQTQLPTLNITSPAAIICGCADKGDIALRPRSLACVGQMLGEEPLVFTQLRAPGAALPEEAPTDAYLLSTIEDILEIWGPGYCTPKVDPDRNVSDELSVVHLRHGCLKLTGEHIDGHKLAHWSPFKREAKSQAARAAPMQDTAAADGSESLSESLTASEEGPSFKSTELLIIGGLERNRRCSIDPRETYENARCDQLIQDLATFHPYWAMNALQFGATGGQWFQPMLVAGLNRNKGNSKKESIITCWQSSHSKMAQGRQLWTSPDFNILNHPWGIVFSLCTSFAKRVPLREALAEVWLSSAVQNLRPRYMQIHQWEQVLENVRKCLKGDPVPAFHDSSSHNPETVFERYLGTLDSGVQFFIHAIVLDLLETLKYTGISEDGKSFKISWLQMSDDVQTTGYEFPTKDVKAEWVCLMRDTRTNATFAVVTHDCLVERRRHTHRCKNHGKTSAHLGTLSLLDTKVIPFQRTVTGWRLEAGGCLLIIDEPRAGILVCQVEDHGARGRDLIVLDHDDVWEWIFNIMKLDKKVRELGMRLRPDYDNSAPVHVTPDRHWRQL